MRLKVNPDTNLVRSGRKTPKFVSRNNSTRTNRTLKKLYPLQFVDADECSKASKGRVLCNNDCNQEDQIEEPKTISSELLRRIAEDMNQTDSSKKTPVRAKVLADDTPVEYYGLSAFERRRLGI